jgi:hypothetical protein
VSLGLFQLVGSGVFADEEVVVLSSDVSTEELNAGVLKLTWEAELANPNSAEATVTVMLGLYDEEGAEIESFTISNFVIPPHTEKTAIQSRPISADVWKTVDSHEVTVEG